MKLARIVSPVKTSGLWFIRSTRMQLAVVTATVAVLGFTGTADAASTALNTPSDNTVTSAKIVNGGVWGTDIHGNTIGEDKLGQVVRQKLNKAATPDVKGTSSTLYQTPLASPVTIDNIGGTFSTRHTSLGQFTLPQGTWMVYLTAKFNRKTASPAGDPEVQPMLQISSGGAHYVTIMGNSISPGLDADLTGLAVGRITVGGDMVFDVNAFGYNSVRGAQGSGEITVTANVVAVAA
jgi:hypothetical protein